MIVVVAAAAAAVVSEVVVIVVVAVFLFSVAYSFLFPPRIAGSPTASR